MCEEGWLGRGGELIFFSIPLEEGKAWKEAFAQNFFLNLTL